MQEYLQAYGTFQQQKLAIATEYAEKIQKTRPAARSSLSVLNVTANLPASKCRN